MTRRTQAAIAVGAAVLVAIGATAYFTLRDRPQTVHVKAESIADEDGHFHWRWTFTSNGRWESFGQGLLGGENVLALEPPGKYDSGPIRFFKRATGSGANVFVYEIEAKAGANSTAPGREPVTIDLKFRGNNGGAPSMTGNHSTQIPERTWRSQFRAIQTSEATYKVPATIRLGVVEGTTEVIEFR